MYEVLRSPKLRRMMQVEAATAPTAGGRCQVCGNTGGGTAVSCQRCQAEVHTDCYTMRKGTDQEWLCDACNDGIENLRCDLCLNEWNFHGGWQPALTKISSSYIHMICAKVKYRRGRLPQNAQCTVCQRGTGKLLGCQDASKCRELCHASCALISGLIDGFSFRCRQHRSGSVPVQPTPVIEKAVEQAANEPAPSIFDHDSVLDLKSVEDGIFADHEHKVENSIFDDQEPKALERQPGCADADKVIESSIFEQQHPAESGDNIDQSALISKGTPLDAILVKSDASHEDTPVDGGNEAGGQPSREAIPSEGASGNLPELVEGVVRGSLSDMIGERQTNGEPELHCDKLLTNIIDRCCEDVADAPPAKKPRNQL